MAGTATAGTNPVVPGSVLLSNVTPGLVLVSNFDGTFDVSAAVAGVYSFEATIDDSAGNTSDVALYTVTAIAFGTYVGPTAVADSGDAPSSLVHILPQSDPYAVADAIVIEAGSTGGTGSPVALPDAAIINVDT